MTTGQIISGIGHGALLAWALIGGLFSRVPDDSINVAEVAIITSEQFAALSTPQPAPEIEQNVPTPTPPQVEDTPPEAPAIQPPPEIQEPRVEETPPPAEEAPDVVQAPPPLPDVQETPPEVTQPPVEDNPVVLAPPAVTASPRPAPRVAPRPVEAPPEDTQVAEEATTATSPDARTPSPSEPTEAAAPEAANDRIVTEAAEPPSSAPTRSARPSARPKRPDPPTEVASSSTRDAIADALAGVQEEAAATQTSAPTGPPLSYGEKDALRVAVSNCWTVDVGGASSRVTVVVSVKLEKNGKVVPGSLRLLSSEGGDETAVGVAYRNARSAIIRCQKGGYKLPIEKYSHWREIEMTFNPEKMRIK